MKICNSNYSYSNNKKSVRSETAINFQKKYMPVKFHGFAGLMMLFASLGMLHSDCNSIKTKNNTEIERISPKLPTKTLIDFEADLTDYNRKVYVNGKNLHMTKGEIENSWSVCAKQFARAKRPTLCLDKNGNISAFVKECVSTGNGCFTGKVIIVNAGHGGCIANPKYPSSTAFDPGASNCKTEPIRRNSRRFQRDKKGQLILKENNKFIGNNGKSLEEWEVSQKYAKDLADRLSLEGAKVLFVSGAVRNAQNAIRDYQKNNKVDLIISLHCNAFEMYKTGIGRNGKEYIRHRFAPGGYLLMPNKRGNFADKEDYKLAETMNAKYQQNSLLANRGNIQQKSLGVLSLNDTQSSPVPGILIEMANLKNSDDVALILSDNYRSEFIKETINGIADYLQISRDDKNPKNKWFMEPFVSLPLKQY